MDMVSAAQSQDHGGAETDATPENIEELIEQMFFAYRDFTSDPDAILQGMDFGRAHHRVLHFVDRTPGLTVAELLDVLRITKQSLARVLKQLVEDGFIEQKPGPTDRRQRHLLLTPKGIDLIARLREPQSRRIEAALRDSGVSVADAHAFLQAMANR